MSSSINNDIALIKINTVTFNKNIQPIQLALETSGSFKGDLAIASGWGLIQDGNPTLPQNLFYLEEMIMNNDECQRYYSIITDTKICTMATTCNDDSGGPLVTSKDSKYGLQQIGIVSFGTRDKCGGRPSVFTRVSKYQTWIQKQIEVYN